MRVWVVAMVCLAAWAQEPKRPLDVLALVDGARALPPEFASDLMLQLAASPAVAETKWKRDLIEEAFLSGAHAQLPYRQRGGPTTDERDSQEASMAVKSRRRGCACGAGSAGGLVRGRGLRGAGTGAVRRSASGSA